MKYRPELATCKSNQCFIPIGAQQPVALHSWLVRQNMGSQCLGQWARREWLESQSSIIGLQGPSLFFLESCDIIPVYIP